MVRWLLPQSQDPMQIPGRPWIREVCIKDQSIHTSMLRVSTHKTTLPFVILGVLALLLKRLDLMTHSLALKHTITQFRSRCLLKQRRHQAVRLRCRPLLFRQQMPTIMFSALEGHLWSGPSHQISPDQYGHLKRKVVY